MILVPSEQLHAMAEAFGETTAYQVVGGQSVTFAEWDDGASRIAHALVETGLQPGDRVLLHLNHGNALRWMSAYAGTHRAGAVGVPLNPQLTRPEVERVLAHCQAKAAFVEESLLDRYDQMQPSILVSVPPAGYDLAGGLTARDDIAAGVTSNWAAMAGHDDGRYFQVGRQPSDLADILYTSGTTGNPKAVAVRHENASLVGFDKAQFNGGKWLHASPVYTFAGLSFVYTPMRLGMQGIYLPSFDAGEWLDVVANEKVESVFLVPAMAKLLLGHEQFASADLSSVQLCTIGSAPLAPRVLEALQDKMPKALVSNNYGMTEAGSVYCLMPPGEAIHRPGSVGKPLPPAEVVCLDDEGAFVQPGEIGHVRLRIPGRAREYFADEEASARTWVNGWLITGDLGKLDDDGYLYIVGRSKDMIIRGGNNIYPTDVEYAIESHPAVREAAVIGVEHPVLGEDVVAFIVLRPDMQATTDEVRDHTLALLARYKVPRDWHLLPELPRNATGKVLKTQLVALVPTRNI